MGVGFILYKSLVILNNGNWLVLHFHAGMSYVQQILHFYIESRLAHHNYYPLHSCLKFCILPLNLNIRSYVTIVGQTIKVTEGF